MSSSYESNAVQNRNYSHIEDHGLNPETKRHRFPPTSVDGVQYHIQAGVHVNQLEFKPGMLGGQNVREASNVSLLRKQLNCQRQLALDKFKKHRPTQASSRQWGGSLCWGSTQTDEGSCQPSRDILPGLHQEGIQVALDRPARTQRPPLWFYLQGQLLEISCASLNASNTNQKLQFLLLHFIVLKGQVHLF